MDITKGNKINETDIFIKWDITEDELKILLKEKLYHDTKGYYTIYWKELGGLEHELGFHFEHREKSILKELEFFRKSYEHQKASFKEFQEYFERNFGAPTKSLPGAEGYSRHEWQLKGVKIFHYMFDRFGLEEHMRIVRLE